MELGIGEWIVIIISVILLVWFFIGNILNNQRAQRLLAWLVASAQNIGKVTSGRMLAPNADGPRAMIKMDVSPVRQIEANLRLLRRENLPLWIYQKIINRKDEITLNLSLNTASPHSLMAFAKKNSSQAVEQANRGMAQALVFLQETNEHRLYYRQKFDPDQVQRLKGFLENNPSVTSVMLRTEAPHLSIRAPIKTIYSLEQKNFLNKLLDLI